MENKAHRGAVAAMGLALLLAATGSAVAQTEAAPPAPRRPRTTPAPTPPPSEARKRFAVEGFAQMGTAPKTDDFEYQSEFGGGGGVSFEVARNLQLRADATSSYSWSDQTTRGGGGVCFVAGGRVTCLVTAPVAVTGALKNMPIFLGPRYFVGSHRARPYLEAGLGINLLEFTTSSSRSNDSVKKTQIGVVPGAGIEVRVSKGVAITAGGRFHVVPEGIDEDEGVKPSFFGGNAGLVIRF